MAQRQSFYPISNFTNKLDEELVTIAKNGDKEALEYLLQKYKNLVNIKVSRYFIVGAEKEDIIQEGMIGLFKAIKCFNQDKQNSFKTFADLCIKRQIITAIKTSTRQKHIPLNSYLSLNISAYDDQDTDTSLIDVFDSKEVEDPLDTITKREYYKWVENKIDETLSDFERQVLHRYSLGDSYVDIAKKLDTPVKSIDNAIQRIRKKVIKNITDEY